MKSNAEIMANMPDAPVNKIGDTDFSFIDGDTVRDSSGNSIRIAGIDTPEVAHTRDVYTEERFRGTAAGAVTTEVVADLARKKGFTEVVISDEKGVYGRNIGDLRNPETGELYSQWAIKNGLAPLRKGASVGQETSFWEGIAERQSGTQDGDAALGRAKIQDANLEQMALSGDQDPFKQNAINEMQYAQDPDKYSGVAIRNPDRTMMNEAKDQWTTSFDTALIGMTDAFGGFQQILGQMTDSPDLVRTGEERSAAARYRMRLNPTTTLDLGEVEGVGDFVDYLANNMAMSVPYMATTIASGATGTMTGAAIGMTTGGPIAAGAGALTGLAVGLSAPMALYSGQVYNEQEVKSEKAALISGFTQAVLDRLGIKGIKTGFSVGSTLKEAEKELIKQGMSKEAAKKIVATESRQVISKYMDDAAVFAKRQVSARNLSREVIARFSKGFGQEAVTEAMQEAVAYAGANHEKENWGILEEGKFADAMLERMGKAAIAGGLLGGSMGAVGAGANRLGWADQAYNLSDGTKNMTKADVWSAEAEKNGDLSHDEFLQTMQHDGKTDPRTDVPYRVANFMKDQKDKSAKDKTIEALFTMPRLWRGQMRANFDQEVLAKSPNARRIWGMLGGALNRVHAGHTFEDAKHFNNQRYIQMSGNLGRKSQGYKGIMRDSKAAKEYSKDFYRVAALKNAHDEAEYNKAQKDKSYTRKEWDWSGTSPNDKSTFQQTFRDAEATADAMIQRQNRSWMSGLVGVKPKFKKINNYLLRYKAIDKKVLQGKREEFQTLLNAEYGMPTKDANDLINRILEPQSETGVDDTVFSMLTNGFHPSNSKKRTIGMSENAKLSEFFSQDVAHNFGEAFRSAARFEAYHDYVGKDKWKINQLMQGMIEDGIDSKEVDKLAWNLERYFQSESGNYKRPPKGTLGDRLLTVQKNLLSYSVLTALPLSAFSSIVELALTMKAMNNEQMYGKNGLMNMGSELGRMMARGFRRVGVETWSGNMLLDKSAVGELINVLGYNEQETGAATTTGATEVSEFRRVWMDNFFKYNGLQGLTNATRAIRASMANDFMLNHMETIMKAEGVDTNAVRQAKQQLRDLGLDVPRLARLIEKDERAMQQFGLDNKVNGPLRLDAEEQAFMKDQMMLATYNFVNDAVALPGAANRPLLYQDPRLALLTQFNGYIATFQATILPKMWGDYIKRGSPMMKFNTFALMATMVILGGASQYLKDWLKYGEGENPYLDKSQLVRRAVNSSGILGTSERGLNLLFPLYGRSENQGLPSMLFDTVTGEAPALSPVLRMKQAASDVYNEEYDKAKYNAFRAAPFVGPATNLAKWISGTGDN